MTLPTTAANGCFLHVFAKIFRFRSDRWQMWLSPVQPQLSAAAASQQHHSCFVTRPERKRECLFRVSGWDAGEEPLFPLLGMLEGRISAWATKRQKACRAWGSSFKRPPITPKGRPRIWRRRWGGGRDGVSWCGRRWGELDEFLLNRCGAWIEFALESQKKEEEVAERCARRLKSNKFATNLQSQANLQMWVNAITQTFPGVCVMSLRPCVCVCSVTEPK